jgi:hypothetical protein
MNIYYGPEDNAAEVLGTVDTIGGYEFNMLGVFKRVEDGALFWDTDNGCSCVSPFDDSDFSNMTRITDPSEFAKSARTWLRESYGASADDRDAIERLIRTVHRRFHTPKVVK